MGRVANHPQYGTPDAFGAPALGSQPIQSIFDNPNYAWSYLVLTFIIFSVALAVLRNMYRSYTGRTNVKKEIKKRIRRVLGDNVGPDSDGRVDRQSFIP